MCERGREGGRGREDNTNFHFLALALTLPLAVEMTVGSLSRSRHDSISYVVLIH